MQYETVIGLEVHAQLRTESKIFCGCSTRFGASPNQNTCPVCLGMPGQLPVLNEKVVEYAIRAALATGCSIAPVSVWARKNYFYPDLPKGYQISQYELPIAEHGSLNVEVDGKTSTIGITRIHMEEDAGKLVHDASLPVSYVDLNRAGVPLVEIVSEPDIRSPEEAAAYMKALRDILVYLEVCDGNLEEGSLRCDANVSLRPVGQEEFGTRTEVKNLNSFRNVARALEYEIRRQRAVLDEGGKVVQETRLWDAGSGKTSSMRGKEEAHDYRYFPDPDLLPLKVDSAWIERVKSGLPELPEAKRSRFVEQYGLPAYDAGVLCAEKAVAQFFEDAVEAGAPAKAASNLIMTDLPNALRGINKDLKDIGHGQITPEQLAEILKMAEAGTLSSKMVKEVLYETVISNKAPSQIVAERGLKQVSDTAELESILAAVFESSPKEVEQFKAGKQKLMGFFVGQVMKRTKGQANPKLVNELIRKMLG